MFSFLFLDLKFCFKSLSKRKTTAKNVQCSSHTCLRSATRVIRLFDVLVESLSQATTSFILHESNWKWAPFFSLENCILCRQKRRYPAWEQATCWRTGVQLSFSDKFNKWRYFCSEITFLEYAERDSTSLTRGLHEMTLV